jgi:trans-aconitate methyltransferase
MGERAAGLMASGDRPGEGVLAERDTLLPWFGPMLEATFAPLFEAEVVAAIPAYRTADRAAGLAVDLGCGNGWYLRRLAARFPHLRGLGLDGFPENVAAADRLAAAEGVADRLTFEAGDLNHFRPPEPPHLIAMNRALHHVWEERRELLQALADHLTAGGALVIWEPAWPQGRATLRQPARRAMAFQNLAEHVQGNRFLHPEEIETELATAGLAARTYRFAGGNEAVVVGTRR